MAISTKFAGFFRGLIGRTDYRAPAKSAAAAVSPAVPSAKPKTTAAPAPLPPSGDPNEIEIPLAPIVAHLPMDLRAKLMASPQVNQAIHLQAEMVINQLAFGVVKISFGELRQLAPGIFVNSGGELDNKLVSLPLQEILPRINSALLARRTAKKIEVADEIAGPFSERGRGFTFTTQPLKAPVAPTPPPEPEPQVPTFSAPPPRQVAPTPPPPMTPPRSATPAAPAPASNGNGHGHSLPVSPLSPLRSLTPAPSPTPGLRLGSTNGHGHAPIPTSPNKMSAPALAPTPVPALPTPRPAAPAPTIFVTLGDLCEHWPEDLKSQILTSPLAHANVPLDGAIIVPGLKRGRVTMTWKQLRILAQPSSPVSPKDNLELELPLKVLAPLFLAAQKNLVKPRAKAAVSSDIPDLFFGFPTSTAAPAPPAAPILPPLPKASEPKAPEPKAPEAKDTNYYVWGENGEAPQADEAALRRGEAPQTDFMNRQAHPKEIVSRAATLPGVAGSVVAMQDGLRVASQVPSDLNADTLAAFLPQIFERVNQSTRELRMGALNNVNFTVGNVPWKIFRVNAVYFAAFGRAGEQLPSVQLAQLAGELDRKKQS